MIKSRQELVDCIEADRSRYHLRKTALHYIFFGDETYAILRFLKRFRKTEYYYNTLNKRNPFSLFRFAYSFFIYRRMQLHYKLFLPLNVIGPGLYIPHRMGGVICNAKKIGKNFTINTGCILGKKNSNEERPVVGDNVEMCIGSKVIGGVFIGNNVIIAPNSVVIKDVSDNDIVSGVPARSIKK